MNCENAVYLPDGQVKKYSECRALEGVEPRVMEAGSGRRCWLSGTVPLLSTPGLLVLQQAVEMSTQVSSRASTVRMNPIATLSLLHTCAQTHKHIYIQMIQCLMQSLWLSRGSWSRKRSLFSFGLRWIIKFCWCSFSIPSFSFSISSLSFEVGFLCWDELGVEFDIKEENGVICDTTTPLRDFM